MHVVRARLPPGRDPLTLVFVERLVRGHYKRMRQGHPESFPGAEPRRQGGLTCVKIKTNERLPHAEPVLVVELVVNATVVVVLVVELVVTATVLVVLLLVLVFVKGLCEGLCGGNLYEGLCDGLCDGNREELCASRYHERLK